MSSLTQVGNDQVQPLVLITVYHAQSWLSWSPPSQAENHESVARMVTMTMVRMKTTQYKQDVPMG